jgi:hypothetical protein
MLDPLNNLPLAAFIAAGVAMLGWIYNHWRERREERRRRREKTRDYQKAIYSEISAYVEVLERDDLFAYAQTLVEKMEKATVAKPYIPFVPKEQNNTIFNALVSDIHILPRVVIDPVVLYYSQLAAIQAMIEDIRGETYSKLEKARRIAIYRDYIAMKNEALTLGRAALREIKRLDDV